MRIFLSLTSVLVCLVLCASDVAAQSSDASFPTPVFTNEISGRIAPRDIGDARLTRHFYAFKSTEGDLTVTVESTNLNGDVDVFTATALRPLLKVTLFGDTVRGASKSVYLRREELLVLRVEARAIGDIEGAYRIRLGGSFAPAPADMARTSEPSVSASTGSERREPGVRRVTSTGARIEEPAPPPRASEEAKTATTPATTPGARSETSASNERPATRREPARARGNRSSRSSTGTTTRRRGTTAPPPATTSTTESAGNETPAGSERATNENAAESNEAAASRTSRPTRNTRPRPSRTSRGTASANSRTEPARTPETASASPQPAASQRLVVVTRDGETLERDMNAVRRVTVENNQLVVVLKDGRVVRQPLANILRMTIEP